MVIVAAMVITVGCRTTRNMEICSCMKSIGTNPSIPRLMELVLEVQPRLTTYWVDAGHVTINNKGLQEIEHMGTNVVPQLLMLMSCQDIGFETFARACSVCERIIARQLETNTEQLVVWPSTTPSQEDGKEFLATIGDDTTSKRQMLSQLEEAWKEAQQRVIKSKERSVRRIANDVPVE